MGRWHGGRDSAERRRSFDCWKGATLDEILSRLSTVEKNIGRPINPTVYSIAEFKSKFASGNHFLNAVLKGQKVFLLGDGDELRKVGEVRLPKAKSDQSC
jgi:hypothetical protein